MTTCKRCNIEKPSEQFRKKWRVCVPCDKAWHAANYRKNKERIDAKNKEWKLANKERVRELSIIDGLRRRYGITLEQYNQLLKSQNGMCAICKSTYSNRKNHTQLLVDHCHISGKIRGLLCHTCNAAIGMLKEDKAILISAVNYIAKNLGDLK